MTSSSEPLFIRNMQLISLVSGASTFVIGAVSLLAWTTGSPTLVAFKSIPAFPFIISGLALCLLQKRKLKSAVHIVGLVFAAALCFISSHDLVDLLMASNQDSLESMS